MNNLSKQTSSLNAANWDAQKVDASVVKNFSNMTPSDCHLEKMKRILKKVECFDDKGFGSELKVGKISNCYTFDENVNRYDGLRWRAISVTYNYMYTDRAGNLREFSDTFTFLQYLFDNGFYKLQDLYLSEREVSKYLDDPSDLLYAMPSCNESSIKTGFIYSSKNLKKRRYEGVMEDLVKKGLEDFRYRNEGGLDDVL